MIHTKKKQVLVAMVTSGTNYSYSYSGNKKGIKKYSQRSIIHTMEYYAATKMSEMMPFAGTWTDLETVAHSEANQKETNKHCI